NNMADLPPILDDISAVEKYNDVWGDFARQRVSGRHINAFKGRLALLEASPAFNTSNDASLWEKAANYNGLLLKDIGGVSGLFPAGHMFYLKSQVDAAELTTGDRKDIAEIIWRG